MFQEICRRGMFQNTFGVGKFQETYKEEATHHGSMCSIDGISGHTLDEWRCWHSSADQAWWAI